MLERRRKYFPTLLRRSQNTDGGQRPREYGRALWVTEAWMAEPPSDSEPSCLQGWGWVSLTVFSSRGSPCGGRHKAKSSLYLPLYLLFTSISRFPSLLWRAIFHIYILLYSLNSVYSQYSSFKEMSSAENCNIFWKVTHAGWSGKPYLETFLYYSKYKPGSLMGESLHAATFGSRLLSSKLGF